jgi:hypothetical protein
MAPFLGPLLFSYDHDHGRGRGATMLDYHNLLVMSVHVAVVVAVTILLNDDGIFSFRRRGEWHCNSESRLKLFPFLE